jgi:hypothetical protein
MNQAKKRTEAIECGERALDIYQKPHHPESKRLQEQLEDWRKDKQ